VLRTLRDWRRGLVLRLVSLSDGITGVHFRRIEHDICLSFESF
jgi:hypothetical protein